MNLLIIFLEILFFACFTFVILLGIINTMWGNGGKLTEKIKELWKK